MARISLVEDPHTLNRMLTVEVDRALDIDNPASAIRDAITEIIVKLAEDWVEKNKDKIYERLNVDAIANMVMVETAKQIKNDITEKEKQ